MPPAPFRHPVQIRYLEVDQQGVVFNMWYLAYFDDAMSAYLAHGGLAYVDMIKAGYDVQVVHTELDWEGSLTWGDDAKVGVSLRQVGRTSFTLAFDVGVSHRHIARARTVYVVIMTDGSGKCAIPPLIREALGPLS